MITRRDILWAIADINREGESDVFPYREDFDELITSEKIEGTIKKVFEMNRTISRLSASQFSEKYNINNIHSTAPKKGGGVRQITLIDPLLNIYYLALAIRIRKKLPKFHPHSFSNIYPDGSEPLSARRGNFRDFCWTNHWIATNNHQQYSMILKLDIADYFGSITPDLIKQAISDSDVGKLSSLLDVICCRGIPVGGNASRIIGELIGAYIDKWLLEQKIHFNRYVDDYVVFVDRQRNPFCFLTEFENHLSRLGFRLNNTKTKAYAIDLQYIFRLPALEINDLLISRFSGKHFYDLIRERE